MQLMSHRCAFLPEADVLILLTLILENRGAMLTSALKCNMPDPSI